MEGERSKTTYTKHSAAKKKKAGLGVEMSIDLQYDEDGKCINAYEQLIQVGMLVGSYGKWKSKPVNMTPGTDKKSMKYLTDLHLKLEDESWKPKPSKRIYIAKANGKLRPLGIPSPRDKIVQESMKAILESVLEPKFLDCSHGFRPKRGCHSALVQIRY
jgi:hypothetical protein